MKIPWSKIGDTLLVIAAITVAAIVVRRELFAKPPMAISGVTYEYVENWKDLVPFGIALDPKASSVTVIEFGDLECPACRAFHTSLTRSMAKDTTLSFLFLHYPLPQHRFARISAQALECANRYGYAAPFMDLIYQKQDSIGLKSWESFGHEAGINDANEFSLCVTSADSIIDSRIDQAMLVASRLQVQSTPTF
jgi:protein-disulfide isomerase